MKNKSKEEVEFIITLHGKIMHFLAECMDDNTFIKNDKISMSAVMAAFLLSAYQINKDFGNKNFGDVAIKSIPLMGALDEQIKILKQMEEDRADK